jgi:hypothetical protein
MNFRERIEKRRENQDSIVVNSEPANDNQQEQSFDFYYFGVENLRNSPACVDLRLADGNRKAIPYTYIMELSFDATNGIEIKTATKKVTITGRDLSRLYNYLTDFRVKYIQSHLGTDANEEGLFVKDIVIKEI